MRLIVNLKRLAVLICFSLCFFVGFAFPDDDKRNMIVSDGIEICEVPDSFPEYPGGINSINAYVQENVYYPVELKQEGIEGRVIMQFVVDKNGDVVNIKIFRSLHPLLDKIALRAIANMPRWTPGIFNGEPVNVRVTFPIAFKIDKKHPVTRNLNGDKKDYNEFIDFKKRKHGKNKPLVLVDGKESTLDKICVEDIKTFTVLKNEEILKKYGKRGKYGVVLITTLKDTSSRSSDEIRPVESWVDEALRGSDKKVVYFLKGNTNPEDRSLKMPSYEKVSKRNLNNIRKMEVRNSDLRYEIKHVGDEYYVFLEILNADMTLGE